MRENDHFVAHDNESYLWHRNLYFSTVSAMGAYRVKKVRNSFKKTAVAASCATLGVMPHMYM